MTDGNSDDGSLSRKEGKVSTIMLQGATTFDREEIMAANSPQQEDEIVDKVKRRWQSNLVP